MKEQMIGLDGHLVFDASSSLFYFATMELHGGKEINIE